MYDAGWVANHDGNLSARVSEARILCTATGKSKADIGTDELLVVNGDGQRISGRARPFSELKLHLAVYRLRPKAMAVVHAHPPYATAFGASGVQLPHPFLPEAVVSIGASIPTVPLSAPGAPAVEALAPYLLGHDAVLIAGNGVLTWGPTLELAFLRMELVEHIAKIAHFALPLGGVKLLPDAMVEVLLDKRRSAGLATPEERRGAPQNHPTIEAATQRVLARLPGASKTEVLRLAEASLDRHRS
ncbi:MAG: class II aldolase/adducin family protein, partial [Myxococcota bacterium]|nr:class II aldolase/adducin family protein [Myxococcota bacterium]